MLRRVVIGVGVALVALGTWLMVQTHARVGVCSILHGAATPPGAGTGTNCVRIVLSYTEGFVFVASGLVLSVIAFTMIARRERLDLKSELKAVPRRWATRDYSITDDSGLGVQVAADRH